MITKTQTIYTIASIRAANLGTGEFWFDPWQMRLFSVHILPTVYQGPGGIFYVSQEKFDPAMPWLYTVRQFHPRSGRISTVRDYIGLRDSAQARKMAKKCATGGAKKKLTICTRKV